MFMRFFADYFPLLLFFAAFKWQGIWVATAVAIAASVAQIAWFHFRAYCAPYASILRFTYLMICANLIQVFRDGLTSIVVFTAVHMMPLTLIVLAHFVLNRGTQRTPSPSDEGADAGARPPTRRSRREPREVVSPS